MIEKVYDGYIVKAGNKYISDYRNGKYTYTTDYTYAKHYTLKTAKKHNKNHEGRQDNVIQKN